ncbi:MAG: hypothetical protein Q4A69_04950 [Moraxella sp.]|nr:hypothetical protein [Moraxella sp.]
MISYAKLVKTIITDPIAVADELWLFKIEIFKHAQKGYFVQLWRLDTYNIKPTFAVQKNWVASETFFIDDGFRFDGLGLYGDDLRYFASSDDCQNYVLKCIDDTFNVS